MSTPLVHYGISLLISYLAGFRGKKCMKMGIFGTIADLDVVTIILVQVLSFWVNMDHDTFLWLNYVFGHREFSHSLLFAFIVSGIVLAVTRKWRTGITVGILMGAHIVMDYLTTWGIRIFFPFWMAKLNFNTIAFFDLVVNGGTLLIIMLFIILRLREWKRTKHRFKWKGFIWMKENLPKIVKYSLAVLIAYMLLIIVAKGVVLYTSEDGGDVEYTEAVPHGLYSYVYCVEENETHWKVVDQGFIPSDREVVYVEKVRITENETQLLEGWNLTPDRVSRRCQDLANGDHDQNIVYFAFDFDVTEERIRVNAYDARREGQDTRTTHSNGFIFEFRDGDLYEFKAYYDTGGFGSQEVPSNRFE